MAAIFSANREEQRVKAALRRINSIQPWFEKQRIFLNDPARHVWQMAASQSGKTQVAVPKFLRRIIRTQMDLRKKHGKYIDRPYWIVVPNFKIAGPVKSKMGDYLPYNSGLIDRAAQSGKAFWNKSERAGGGTAMLKYGASITFKSFEQGEGLVAESLGGIWIDECARCDDATIWANLFARLKETKGWTIGTSSPAARNSFYTKIRQVYDGDDEHSWLTWTSYDSAHSKYSAITLKEVEKARATMAPHMFAREYLAEWSSAEGLIYPNFDYARNVVEKFPFANEKRFFMGMDIGFSHPTAIVTCSESETRDGKRIFVESENILEMTAPSDIVEALAAEYRRYKPFAIWFDYGGGGSFLPLEWEKYWRNEERRGKCTQLEAARAMTALDMAYKGPQSVNDGIALVGGIISNRQKPLLFGDKCKKLFDELDGYVWEEHENQDKPRKENDDALDALRYALSNYAWQYASSSDQESLFGLALAG